jgi:hypothetical protein
MNQQTQAQHLAIALKIEEAAAAITAARINSCPNQLGDEDVKILHINSTNTVLATILISMDALEAIKLLPSGD